MKEKEKAASGLLTRRGALVAGAVAVGGVIVARRFPKILPPTCGNVLRAGDTFTYGMQKALLSDGALAKEYRPEDLTSFPATGTIDPGAGKGQLAEPELAKAYRRLKDGGFADWRLPVGGAVAKPREFSLSELKQFPPRTQITRHTCEEGWSAIGQWTGVPFSAVLDAVGILPEARFVVYRSYDGWVDSIDMPPFPRTERILNSPISVGGGRSGEVSGSPRVGNWVSFVIGWETTLRHSVTSKAARAHLDDRG